MVNTYATVTSKRKMSVFLESHLKRLHAQPTKQCPLYISAPFLNIQSYTVTLG